jgi:hypothetical protein
LLKARGGVRKEDSPWVETLPWGGGAAFDPGLGFEKDCVVRV